MKKLLLLLILCPISLYSQWVQQDIPAYVTMVLTIDFADVNHGIAGGTFVNFDFTGRMMYTTNSGTNWNVSQIPDSSRAIVKVQMIDANTGYAVGAYNTIAANSHSGILLNQAARRNSEIIEKYYSRLGITRDLISGYKGMFLKTTNGGVSWNLINTLPANVYYLVGMRFANINTGYVAASLQSNPQGFSSILKTTNGGLAWQSMLTIDSMDFSKVCTPDGVNVYAGAWGRNGTFFDGYIVRSSNGGTNWTRQDFTNTVSFIEDVNFINSNTGFAVSLDNSYRALILKTTNSGLNWTRLSFQPLNTHYYGIEFAGTTGKGIAVGSSGPEFNGLIISRTTDFGNNWTSLNITDSVEFSDLSLVDQNNWFVCGGGYNGLVYKSTNGGAIGIHPISNEIPRSYALSQNYPNPFNPETKIKFDIPANGNVNMVLYDITGRVAATLVNENLTPGSYEINFNAAAYSSGVYFYRLTSGSFTQTKKMLLVK